MADGSGHTGRAIPPYTEKFMAQNARARRDTLKKLGREFGFDPEHPPVDPRRLEIIDIPEYGLMGKLGQRIDTCTARAGVELDDEKKGELLGVCRDFARSVGELSQLRTFVKSRAIHIHDAEESARRSAEQGPRLWDEEEQEGRRERAKIHHALALENAYAHHVVQNALVRMRPFLSEEGDDAERRKVKDRATIGLMGGVIQELINNCNIPCDIIEPYRPPRGANIESWNDDIMGGFLERIKANLNNEHRTKTAR